jgi:transglutaminase-like putative cysteine protease
MLYDIRLRLDHTYAGRAGGARHLTRVMPAILPGRQVVQTSLLTCNPVADTRNAFVDFFGNRATVFFHDAPHDAMRITMQARVQCLTPEAQFDISPDRARLATEIAAIGQLTAHAPHHFLGPSPRVPVRSEIAAFAADVTAPVTGGVLAQVQALGRAVFKQMTFDASATTVDTPMVEAFVNRHGVCQDYSHILIAGLRSLGIPARYVSGFLRTLPPPGQARLEGADAMHAWVSAWCGSELGWVEYDPTNDIAVQTDHIVVAYGRDYSDVSPIKGVLRTASEGKSAQAVDVAPVA